jgi:predicted aspartyl protease
MGCMKTARHRRTLHRVRTALVCGIGAALSAVPASAACKLTQIGEVMVALRGVPVAPVSINGHTAQLIIDTGSSTSLLWRSAIAPLGLRRIGKPGEMLSGVGGRDLSELVRVRDLGFAGGVAHDIDFQAAGATTETRQFGPDSVVGLLGEDFLAAMDVEFDLKAQRIRLFRPAGCQGDQVVYWAQAYFMVPLSAPPIGSHWIEAHVSLNGHDAVALFDSGASASTVAASVAQRSGMTPETGAAAAQKFRGVGSHDVNTAVARFATLTIGQETIHNPKLHIADLFANQREVKLGSYIKQSDYREPDLLIGADFLEAHRVYVSRSQGKLYFTYEGGGIFEPAAAAPPDQPSEQ